jgi:hypothetical protein
VACQVWKEAKHGRVSPVLQASPWPSGVSGTNRGRASLLAVGGFLAIGAVFDLAGDAGSQLPGDHASTFRALTGTIWQRAASNPHSAAPYVTHMEIAYSAYELLFAVVILAVAAIPLRRGERWAWWCSWLIVLPVATLAWLFGAHDSGNLITAIVVAIIAIIAIIALLALLPFTTRPSSPARNSKRQALRPFGDQT